MARDEVRAMGERLLTQAGRLRAAFPDPVALAEVVVPAPPPVEAAGDPASLASALAYLRDEMLLVRAGGAESLGVLDDEVANVERLLAGG